METHTLDNTGAEQSEQVRGNAREKLQSQSTNENRLFPESELELIFHTKSHYILTVNYQQALYFLHKVTKLRYGEQL